MGIDAPASHTNVWDDTEQTIIRINLEPHGEWCDFFRAIADGFQMIRATPHNVDVIVTGAKAYQPSNSLYRHMEAINISRPENLGRVIVVNPETAFEATYDFYMKITNSPIPVMFSPTLNHARMAIAMRRANASR